jgi:hypothetical protein
VAVLGGAVLAIFVPLFRKEETLESAVLEKPSGIFYSVRRKSFSECAGSRFQYKCGKLSKRTIKKFVPK